MPKKEKFLASSKYAPKRHLLWALLDEDKEYTTKEVDKLITAYEKKEVK